MKMRRIEMLLHVGEFCADRGALVFIGATRKNKTDEGDFAAKIGCEVDEAAVLIDELGMR